MKALDLDIVRGASMFEKLCFHCMHESYNTGWQRTVTFVYIQTKIFFRKIFTVADATDDATAYVCFLNVNKAHSLRISTPATMNLIAI